MNVPKNFKIRYDRIIAVAVIFILIIILIASAINKFASEKEKKPDAGENSSAASSSDTSSDSSSLTGTVTKVTKAIDEIHTGNLILVNKTSQYVLPTQPAAVSIKENKTSSHYYYVDNVISLNTDVITALDSLMEGYFSVNQSEDMRILDAFRNGTTTDMSSELSTGLSFNLGLFLSDGTYSQYTPTDKYGWITQNCHNYGFIVRYTEDKTSLTGVDADVSHFRYVGVPHSKYMTDNGMCLEEYIESVKSYDYISNRLKIECNGKNYEVYYVKANTVGDTEIYIDPGKTYEISGNNTDGFIVTVEV